MIRDNSSRRFRRRALKSSEKLYFNRSDLFIMATLPRWQNQWRNVGHRGQMNHVRALVQLNQVPARKRLETPPRNHFPKRKNLRAATLSSPMLSFKSKDWNL